jgi:hypothetical protein
MKPSYMKYHDKYLSFLAGAVLALLLACGPCRAEPTAQVDQTIQHLIGYVSGSGLTFIRNSGEYTPAEAAEHMNRKYQHTRGDIETPDEFIELCATKSLLSGKPYLVVAAEGKEQRTSDWLRAELAAYQVHSQ